MDFDPTMLASIALKGLFHALKRKNFLPPPPRFSVYVTTSPEVKLKPVTWL